MDISGYSQPDWYSFWYIFLCFLYCARAGSTVPNPTRALQGILAGKGEVWLLGFWYPRVWVLKNFGIPRAEWFGIFEEHVCSIVSIVLLAVQP